MIKSLPTNQVARQLGNNIVQLSNTVYFAELMNTSTIYVDPGFCRINSSVEIKGKNITIVPAKKIPKDVPILTKFISV